MYLYIEKNTCSLSLCSSCVIIYVCVHVRFGLARNSLYTEGGDGEHGGGREVGEACREHEKAVRNLKAQVSCSQSVWQWWSFPLTVVRTVLWSDKTERGFQWHPLHICRVGDCGQRYVHVDHTRSP